MVCVNRKNQLFPLLRILTRQLDIISTFPSSLNPVSSLKPFIHVHILALWLVCFVFAHESARRSLLSLPVHVCWSQCVFAQRQRLCKCRNGLCLQVLYVPDPECVSSVGSSPSLSPISPLSPTSSEADLEKVTVCWPHLRSHTLRCALKYRPQYDMCANITGRWIEQGFLES